MLTKEQKYKSVMVLMLIAILTISCLNWCDVKCPSDDSSPSRPPST